MSIGRIMLDKFNTTGKSDTLVNKHSSEGSTRTLKRMANIWNPEHLFFCNLKEIMSSSIQKELFEK